MSFVTLHQTKHFNHDQIRFTFGGPTCIVLGVKGLKNLKCHLKTAGTKKFQVPFCHLAVICQMLNVDPREMLNNFCFHVYAQKSLFIAENVNAFFLTPTAAAPDPLTFEFIELVPS